jgi:hypothetical protein
MKRVTSKCSPDPDISGWSIPIPALESLRRDIEKVIAEAIDMAMQDTDTYITFPVEWADDDGNQEGSDGVCGPAVDDPLTVYLRIAINNSMEPTTYSFSLRDALKDTIETCSEDGSFSSGLKKLSSSLRDLASEIDAAIANGANP